MEIDNHWIRAMMEEQGDAFYLLDTLQFEQNFRELQAEFRRIYPETYLAYSYKTNYIPSLCQAVHTLGGYAEVVSSMEYEIALRSGVEKSKVSLNGPYKEFRTVEDILLHDGMVNIDGMYEWEMIKELLRKYPERTFSIGIRCNFDVGDGVVSRFGFDVEGEEFERLLGLIEEEEQRLRIKGVHCHFADRSLKTWPRRIQGMLKIMETMLKETPEYLDLGGGLYGKMPDSLKDQFGGAIPTYREYAQVARELALWSGKRGKKPRLLIEPGSALSGDVMKFVTKVINIKEVRGKKIATLSGSVYNINPTLNRKNPPIEVAPGKEEGERQEYYDLDFGGYTCIESDYLYRHYHGKLAVGDYIIFHNAGSYSIVLKPPFILPNFAVIELRGNGETRIIKRKEEFEDIFRSYQF